MERQKYSMAEPQPKNLLTTEPTAEHREKQTYFSPTGKLLMKKELVGKSFVISQEDIARDWSDEPTIAETNEADSLIQVQIGVSVTTKRSG